MDSTNCRERLLTWSPARYAPNGSYGSLDKGQRWIRLPPRGIITSKSRREPHAGNSMNGSRADRQIAVKRSRGWVLTARSGMLVSGQFQIDGSVTPMICTLQRHTLHMLVLLSCYSIGGAAGRCRDLKMQVASTSRWTALKHHRGSLVAATLLRSCECPLAREQRCLCRENPHCNAGLA